MRDRFPKAAPDGLLAAALLAFLATAGFFYVNIMPAIVSGLIDDLHFSQKAAGLVGSANVYGAALGALIAVFLIRHIRWQPAAALILCALIAMDLLSILVRAPGPLTVMRFAHGTIGGLLVGIAFAVIGRTRIPERTFGMLLVVQAGAGGFGVMFLPRLVPIFGAQALFLALALFSSISLMMLPFLPAYPPRPTPLATDATRAQDALSAGAAGLIGALLAVFFFQAGNMGLAAYMIELGRSAGLTTNFASTVIAIAGWIATLGSALTIFVNVRWGRRLPLLIAFALTLLGNAAFHLSNAQWIFALANAGTAVLWTFVIPYLLGMCTAFNRGGRAATLAGVFSKLGLASGPLAASLLTGGGHFGALINLSVVALAVSGALAIAVATRLDRNPA